MNDLNDEGFVEHDSPTFTTIEVIERHGFQLPQHIKSAKLFRQRAIRNNAFHLIYSTMLVMGIPIQFPASKSSLKGTFIKAFFCASLVFKLLTLVFAVSYVYFVFPDYSTILSYYVFGLSGDLTMLILVLKRRKIKFAIQEVTRLSIKFNLKTVGSKFIKYELMAFVLIGMIYIAVYFTYFFYEKWDLFLENLQVPFGLSQSYIRSYAGIVLASFCSYSVFNVLTCMVTFILLYNAFLSLVDLIESFNLMILKEKSSISDPASIKKFIAVYGKIFTCVKRVDEALNACCFLMLGTVVGSFFAAVTVTFSGNDRYQTLAVKVLLSCTLVGCPVMFILIAITGSRLVSGYNGLKAILLGWSEEMGRYLSDPSVIRLFVLFADNVRKSNLAVTGCQMFAINKGLILTVGSTVITYSFLLLQLDNDDPNEP